ncbi:trypsin-like peptidase domain-containing protein [Streptomyces boncukensis]|uniref:VMAP-C domain-containing protein n=1 Tax=Streptomyces boncukensis TaxID=2711219 RepID=UPI0030BA11BC
MRAPGAVTAPGDVESAVSPAVVRIGAVDGGYDRLNGRGTEAEPGVWRPLWGSGFFVAPGWVLTCAHVVGSGGSGAVWRGERAIGIRTEDGVVLTGELAFGLPVPRDPGAPPSPWPLPDLALIRVPEATDPECLWLSDRSALTPAEVGLYGWMPGPSKDEPLFFSGTGDASGGVAGPMMLSGGQLTQGCSGGPVVDLWRGAVIGVSKGKGRGPGAGLAVPVTALRRLCDAGPRGGAVLHEVLSAHDRHHLRRYHAPGDSWPRRQTRMELSAAEPHGFTADRRTRLYALFARLDPPTGAGQVLQLANEARDFVLQSAYTLRDHDPRSWREGAGLLYDPRDGRTPSEEPAGDLSLEAVVLYAAKVWATLARSRAALPGCPLGALREWIESTAPTLRNDVIRARIPQVLAADSAAVAARADVLVEIDPDIYGTGRHSWRVLLQYAAPDGSAEAAEPAVVPVAYSGPDAPRRGLEESLRGALSAALDQGDVGEHLAAVAFMLPRALFDEPVEQWRPRLPDPADPLNPHTLPLGQRRLVVVRDRLRRDQGVTPEWRARASAVAEGPLHAVPLRREVPAEAAGQTAHGPGAGPCEGAARPYEGEQAAYGRLLAVPPGAVPVYCSRTGDGPGARAMGAALTAGHVLALWRHTDSGHTDCAEFHEGAARLLGEVRAARHLPERIRTLRNGNADEGAPDPGTLWARHIVLLYDPPHRPPRDGVLREPPMTSRPPDEGGPAWAPR